ncbi:OmpP1/FadL family transporter [Mucilaginibacter paludis]|uniref:Membrane protein involved in aromatic hydrocarbon degradation n=1 Tax=Mucilaginibacter paludis DSM 18603 TaxID=714943 RepID=H1Y536_9SPHI|nr:outer membrane protein transport protein [Mucilaginibacter paludis]EHQ28579.1 membrane protein involved in aromatic hydrocarbon degradation [Mucilaginibacter paludis DSM 18603]
MRRVLLIGLALLPVMAMAQGFQVNLHGQKQVGMGNTGTGIVQDGASILFNPGAVAMLPENYIQGGISPLVFQSAFQSTGSSQYFNNKNEIATPFTFYAAWGPKASFWKIGLGVYTPFGGLTNWGNTWDGKYALESLNLKAIYFQPTLSVKLADFLSIGGGFVYDYGSVDLQRGLPVSSDAAIDIKGHGHGYGWNAGIYIKTEVGMTVGITHRSNANTSINNGDVTYSGTIPASIKATQFPDGTKFNAAIDLPSTTSVGFGFYPTNKWTIGVDLNYVRWRSYKSLDFNFSQSVGGSTFSSSARNYKDAYDFRGGAEYKATQAFALRFGGGYATTSVRDGYVTPEAPDANRVYGTVGLGYTLAKKLDIDFAFEYEHLMNRTQTNIESGLSGTFKTDVWIPGISLAYHW